MHHLLIQLFLLLFFIFGYPVKDIYSNIDEQNGLPTILLDNDPQLREILFPQSTVQRYKPLQGIIPESMTKRGVILFANELDNNYFKLHEIIINAIKDPYLIIVITANPYKYQIKKWKNKKNLIIIKSELKTDRAIWGRDYFPELAIEKDGLHLKQFQYYWDESEVMKWVKSLAKNIGTQLDEVPIKLEGGNLTTDDEGHLFLSDVVLDKDGYDPLKEDEVMEKLKNFLGVQKVTLLPKLPFDGTGHIDMFAKIIGHKKVLVADSRSPKRHTVLEEVANIFAKEDFEVIRIMNADWWEDRAPFYTLTYTNSYIIGNVVLMPIYSEPLKEVDNILPCESEEKQKVFQQISEDDAMAIQIYKNLGYQVVPIPAAYIIQASGAIHCITKSLY